MKYLLIMLIDILLNIDSFSSQWLVSLKTGIFVLPIMYLQHDQYGVMRHSLELIKPQLGFNLNLYHIPERSKCKPY